MELPNTLPISADDFAINEDDIKHTGSLLKESYVMKWWKRRWCVVTSQYLCSFKSDGDYANPTEVLILRDCLCVRSADDEIGKENSFCVVTQRRTFYLIANSAKEKEAWIAAIMNNILPELLLRGLRRSLMLFPIDEQYQEDGEEQWKCSPDLLFKSFLASKSRDKLLHQSFTKPISQNCQTFPPSSGEKSHDFAFQVVDYHSKAIDSCVRKPTLLDGERYPFQKVGSNWVYGTAFKL